MNITDKILREQLMFALSNISVMETDEEYCKILDIYEKHSELIKEEDFIAIETGAYDCYDS